MSIFQRFKKDDAISRPPKSNAPAPVKAQKAEAKAPAAKPKAERKASVRRVDSEAYRLLGRPIVTEKTAAMTAMNKYVFEVPLTANRLEVATAIAALYEVHPIKVNMIRSTGKFVRYGRFEGSRSDWKKAIITLRAGESITVQDGV